MTRASAVVAMYATALFGLLLLHRRRPWHVVGTALGLMLLNVALFSIAANAPGRWTGVALSVQVVATTLATASIRREWSVWKMQSAAPRDRSRRT